MNKYKVKGVFVIPELFHVSENPNIKEFIPLPPPNVTSKLHIGHSVMLTLEDIMTRYHRMKGDSTLLLPGTDHA